MHAVITGSGFTPASTVLLSGELVSATYQSSTELSFDLPSVPSSPGAVDLTVGNVAPGGGFSQASLVILSGTISYDAAARFLQQASWGPTPSLIAHVQQIGFKAYLDEQFASTEDSYSDPNFQWVEGHFLQDISQHEQSQLRTKVGWAWYKLFNSPGTTVTGMLSSIPNVTQRDAFGNYTNLLSDVSLNIEMGFYFNYCCSDISNTAGEPDQNIAREIMQQFSIGPNQLNTDGTVVQANSGSAVPAYSMDDVRAISRSVTGLTYDQNAAWASADPEGLVPMTSADARYHDAGEKLILGNTIPAGLDAQSELLLVVKLLAANPNTGRHLSSYLIHELVTSNPSPAYVQRVAAAWANDGKGLTGNLQAVVEAVLLDPEARGGDDTDGDVLLQLWQNARRYQFQYNCHTRVWRNANSRSTDARARD